jgi:phenylalanyl-tRNA synthetase beta chain
MYSRKKIKFAEITKFPSVVRDLAIIIDEKISFAEINKKLLSQGGSLLKKVELFDIYKDKIKIGEGKKSYALSFTLLDDKKTLTEAEIDKIFHKLMRTLENEFQALIRK